MDHTGPPIRAATEVARAHGISPDRCDILQDGNTLVLRLTESLVARVVQDREGPRTGTAWFSREIAVARHLAEQGAPVIPVHPDIPPGPHEHLGYPMNFWKFVTITGKEADPADVGATLARCHEILRGFSGELPHLAILSESLVVLDAMEKRGDFPAETAELLRHHLSRSLEVLAGAPAQPLHGDAHFGNLLTTTDGLLWTDWEDTFAGPVEWDLASILWNARYLDHDEAVAEGILSGYTASGGSWDSALLEQCATARAAVMSAWYPVLYPQPSEERRAKLAFRLEWLAGR